MTGSLYHFPWVIISIGCKDLDAIMKKQWKLDMWHFLLVCVRSE